MLSKTLMTEEEAEKKYNELLYVVIDMIGHDVTTWNDELEEVGRELIPNFKGVFTPDRIPSLPHHGDSCIVNNKVIKGEHWLPLINNYGKLYIYDSFGRQAKKLSHYFKDLNDMDTTDAEQDKRTNSCGQRAIAFIMFWMKYGFDNAMLL